jgi:hypothetical protein
MSSTMHLSLQSFSDPITAIIVSIGILGAFITFILNRRNDLLTARKTKAEIKKLELEISNAKSTMVVSPSSDSAPGIPPNEAKKRRQISDRTVSILTIIFICYNYAIFMWQMYPSGSLTRQGLGTMILSAGSALFLLINWMLSLCVATMMKVHKSILESIFQSTSVLADIMATSAEIYNRGIGDTNTILKNVLPKLILDKPSDQPSAEAEKPVATSLVGLAGSESSGKSEHG